MAYYVSSALDANVAEGPLVIRAGVSPANVDRAVASIDEEVDAAGARWPDAEGSSTSRGGISSARSRARSRPTPRSRTSCRPKSSSASASTTTRGCRTCSPPSRSTKSTRRHGAPWIPIARRSSSPDLTAGRRRLFCFDVDFTLIYPGPTFRGEGYQAFCARYGMDVDAGRSSSRASQRAAAEQPRRHLRRGGVHRVHEPHHRADGRKRAAHRRVLA